MKQRFNLSTTAVQSAYVCESKVHLADLVRLAFLLAITAVFVLSRPLAVFS